MKKIGSILMLLTITMSLTGCVKFNAKMEIGKDKSLLYSIVYAFDKSMMQGESLIDDDEKENLSKDGFEVEPYSDDKMEGVTVTKKIDNIDDVSLDGDVTYVLSDVMNDDADNSHIFSVKKGFFKNVYKANFKFSSNSDDQEIEDNSTIEDSAYVDESDGNDTSDFGDLSDSLTSLTNSMDLKYTVKLPYEAISNNATNVSDDKLTLDWVLTTNKVSSIEFEFPIYNMTNIYLAIGLGVIILAGMAVLIFKRR